MAKDLQTLESESIDVRADIGKDEAITLPASNAVVFEICEDSDGKT